MTRARRLPDGSVVQVFEDEPTRPFAHYSDWARVDAMTEEEIEANALSDPDNPPISAERLAHEKSCQPKDDSPGVAPDPGAVLRSGPLAARHDPGLAAGTG